jgi:hypothetical protein
MTFAINEEDICHNAFSPQPVLHRQPCENCKRGARLDLLHRMICHELLSNSKIAYGAGGCRKTILVGESNDSANGSFVSVSE